MKYRVYMGMPGILVNAIYSSLLYMLVSKYFVEAISFLNQSDRNN